MLGRSWPCGLLLAVALAACSSQEPAPAKSTTGRSETPASGERALATGRTGGGGPQAGALPAAFLDRVVTDFCGQVSQRHARGWPAHVIRGDDGLPTAVIRVQDRRGAGEGQDAELLRARLTRALTEQGVLGVREGDGQEPEEPEDPIEPGDPVDTRREDTTSFAVQVDLQSDGAATVVEARLVDLGGEQAVLIRVRLRHAPG